MPWFCVPILFLNTQKWTLFKKCFHFKFVRKDIMSMYWGTKGVCPIVYSTLGLLCYSTITSAAFAPRLIVSTRVIIQIKIHEKHIYKICKKWSWPIVILMRTSVVHCRRPYMRLWYIFWICQNTIPDTLDTTTPLLLIPWTRNLRLCLGISLFFNTVKSFTP